MNKQKTTSCKN